VPPGSPRVQIILNRKYAQLATFHKVGIHRSLATKSGTVATKHVVFRMELACHHAEDQNFEMASRFLKNWGTEGGAIVQKYWATLHCTKPS
jgi:hypothetical protein